MSDERFPLPVTEEEKKNPELHRQKLVMMADDIGQEIAVHLELIGEDYEDQKFSEMYHGLQMVNSGIKDLEWLMNPGKTTN